MNGWLTFWYGVLILSCVSFAVMLLMISLGAFRELQETLQELRGDSPENND